MEIEFKGKIFCFTGKLAELKRDLAEKEVRARNGLSQNLVNNDLDYLVIGSVSSPGWKNGSYGNKIEKAKKIVSESKKLNLVSESDFITALEKTTISNPGDIDEKLLIIRYSAHFLNGDIDITRLEKFIETLQTEYDAHIFAHIEEPFIYRDLYNHYIDEELNDLLLFKCRIVKQFKINSSTNDFIDSVVKGFGSVENLNGKITWSEKKEGTASYSALLKVIPIKTKLT